MFNNTKKGNSINAIMIFPGDWSSISESLLCDNECPDVLQSTLSIARCMLVKFFILFRYLWVGIIPESKLDVEVRTE